MNNEDLPSPPPPRQTGPQALPRAKTGQHPVSRKTTGVNMVPRSPSGGHAIRPPTGSYSSGHAHPPKRADYTVFYILGGVMIVVCIAYFAMRDTWERDNKGFILGLKHDAETLRATQKRSAYEKYDTLVKLVAPHTLKDPEVKSAYDDARRQLINVSIEMQEESDAKIKSGEKLPDAKGRAQVYGTYEKLTQPLLDALLRCKASVESNPSPAKYRDDVAEASSQYFKWWDALDDAQASYPSAKLLIVARDSYSTAGDWWTIETEKKMPAALFANIEKRQEWEQGAYALGKVKLCMDAKDLLERKPCRPCDGTGKLKCPICLGTGICSFCKGKGDPVVQCCDNGVCYACKGRKESGCKICNSTGEFPAAKKKE